MRPGDHPLGVVPQLEHELPLARVQLPPRRRTLHASLFLPCRSRGECHQGLHAAAAESQAFLPGAVHVVQCAGLHHRTDTLRQPPGQQSHQRRIQEKLRRPLAFTIFSTDLLFCCHHTDNWLEINQLLVVTTRCRVTTNALIYHYDTIF